MATSLEDLSSLATVRPPATSTAHPEGHGQALEDLMALIQQHDAPGYAQALQQQLAREGLLRFVQDTMAPLSGMIGQAWEDGRVQVFEEHLFTELSKRVLRQAIASVGGGHSPRVVLTTLPDEPHGLGLLMVEGILSLEGAHCIPLGTQMPMLSIVEAASAHRADLVALSFSAAFPARQIPVLLRQLRHMLPDGVALWAGGSGVGRLPPLTGIQSFSSLSAIQTAVANWRANPAAPV
jgi:MerR family transcriptional regulator, light-induced transcriptional regulator